MTELTSIGGLRDALADLNQTAAVYIDNRPPTALSSYRGYYSDLAIERAAGETPHEMTQLDDLGEPFELNMAGYGTYTPGHAEVRIKVEPTVADLVEALDLADGESFEGYKGGQFRMDADTDLWVSEYGQCDHLRVHSIEELMDRVDLWTQRQEGY